MEQLLDLGEGLFIYKVAIDELIEQDVNARAMGKAAMDRLSKTVFTDKRLESLPFCALTEKGMEIVSGHHRTRAARKAGLTHVYVVGDSTGLTRDQIAAKQLAHNSIQGDDDPQLVKLIFEGIQDVQLKLEAFIDPEKISYKLDSISVGQLQVGVLYEVVVINFFPVELARFNEALAASERLIAERDLKEMHVSVLENYERFRAAVSRAKKEYDVRATGTALDIMATIVLEQLGEEQAESDDEVLPLRSLFGTSVIPAKFAKKVKARVKKDIDAGVYPKDEAWRLLESIV